MTWTIPGDEEFDDIEEQEIIHQYPRVEVIADADVLVMPFTADSVEDAIGSGRLGHRSCKRWSKAKIRQDDPRRRDRQGSRPVADPGDGGKKGKQTAGQEEDHGGRRRHQVRKAASDRACLQDLAPRSRWTASMRLVRIYFGGADRLLSVQAQSVLVRQGAGAVGSAREECEGSFKGKSARSSSSIPSSTRRTTRVNEGMDSAAYALLPIIMTDPEKNPRVGSMVLNVAAIWETSPKDTQFAQFPQLWKEAFQIVASCKDQIFQTLGINPAMMPQQVTAPGKKPNQAQIANEQQVDILTTADAVTGIEGEILTPMLQWFIWLDHQFRDKEITDRGIWRARRPDRDGRASSRCRWTVDSSFAGLASRRRATIAADAAADGGINMLIKGIPTADVCRATSSIWRRSSPSAVENTFGPRSGRASSRISASN